MIRRVMTGKSDLGFRRMKKGGGQAEQRKRLLIRGKVLTGDGIQETNRTHDALLVMAVTM